MISTTASQNSSAYLINPLKSDQYKRMSTMHELRFKPRFAMTMDVKISTPLEGDRVLVTKNISDSGMFLVGDSHLLPELGAIVDGEIQELIETVPIPKMKVVRVEPQGVAVEFIASS